MARSIAFSWLGLNSWTAGAGLACALSVGCAGPKVAQTDAGGPLPAAPPAHVQTSFTNYSEATPPLIETRESPQNRAQLHLAYGQLQEQRGEAAAARESYHKALEAHPPLVEARIGLARLDLAAGRITEAEDHLKNAVQSQPKSAFALAAMGQFHGDQGNWDLALDYYARAMNAAPDDKRYTFQMAVALAKSGRIDQSMPLFIRSVGEAAGHHNIAVVLEQQGNAEGAVQHAELALAKDPGQEASRNLLLKLRGGLPSEMAEASGPVIRPGPAVRSAQRAQPEIEQVSAAVSVADPDGFGPQITPGKKRSTAVPAVDAAPVSMRPQEPLSEEWQRMPVAPRNPLERSAPVPVQSSSSFN